MKDPSASKGVRVSGFSDDVEDASHIKHIPRTLG
jgi:hypothetical protein